MSELLMRSESHEIDTEARKRVPSAFPSDWEYRELTGRDYGIDMIMEKFRRGNPTGNYLGLQIKGTTKQIKENITTISYDLSVRTLRYLEMFMSPVLLTICPIKDENNRVFYLWLQKYIDVILDFDNPNWRSNQETVRIHIPVNNVINKNIEIINWISYSPKRMKESLQMSFISMELERDIDNFFCTYELFINDEIGEKEVDEVLNSIINHIDAIQKIESIFGDKKWISPQTFLEETIIPSNKLVNKLLENKKNIKGKEVLELSKLKSTASFIKMLNDVEHQRSIWKCFKEHDF